MAIRQGAAAVVRSPQIFALLYLPSGIFNGYVGVLVYLLARSGLGTAVIGGVLALGVSILIWSFFWAPLADLSLTYKGWYKTSALALSAIIAASALIRISPASAPALMLVVLAGHVAWSFMAVAAGGLVAHSTAPAVKGRAGGWSQAGYLGGGGLSGGGGLWLATHAAPWITAVVLGVLCAASSLAVLLLPEPRLGDRSRGYWATLKAVGDEVMSLARGRTGAMAMFVLLLPFGTSAAADLFPAVARDWSASASLVALTKGTLSGVISILTTVAGGYLADRWDRKSAYVAGGALMAACAVAMALAPKTPATFAVFVLLYAAAAGLIWGAFGGVVLEAAGRGAAATKGNILSCLCNAPIAVMIAVDGWTQSHWGSSGMLLGEAGVAVAGIVLFLGVRLATAPRPALVSA